MLAYTLDQIGKDPPIGKKTGLVVEVKLQGEKSGDMSASQGQPLTCDLEQSP